MFYNISYKTLQNSLGVPVFQVRISPKGGIQTNWRLDILLGSVNLFYVKRNFFLHCQHSDHSQQNC